MFPITIKMSEALIFEFADCEYGAHEDAIDACAYADSEVRNAWEDNAVLWADSGCTAYQILTRHRDRIEIRSASEADLIYYAACSGTFALARGNKLDDMRRKRAANRIADILRPHAKPETVARWPRADGY